MTPLRALLLLILLIGLLPWGAFSGEILPKPTAVSASMDASNNQPRIAGPSTAEMAVHEPTRRCKRAALPGGTCAMDMMVREGPDAPRAPDQSAGRPGRTVDLRNWTPPGALDPPRQG